MTNVYENLVNKVLSHDLLKQNDHFEQTLGLWLILENFCTYVVI